ncbi:MAG: TlpA disulfide reductase family protein [Fodinibius sp.]|nr:TlpA disulfide reductase family protein [Fodinibius sp.]
MNNILQTLLCAGLAVALLGIMPRQQAHPQNTDFTGPDTLLKDVTADELQQIIASYRGEKAVLVNIWATWCAPCVEEFPEIVELQHNYPDDLKVIFVSADFPKQRPDALDFLKKQQVNWTTYFKTGKDQEFIESLSPKWTGALPFTKIIDRNGDLVASWEQSADYDKFERHVKTAIKP